MIALGVGLDSDNDIGQRPISAVGKCMLIVDFIDRIGRDEARADDLLELSDDLIEGEHGNVNSMQSAEYKLKNAKLSDRSLPKCGWGEVLHFALCTFHFALIKAAGGFRR